MKRIDWNVASKLGLIEQINDMVLHPLGLAMSRTPASGTSEFICVSDDNEPYMYSDNKRIVKLTRKDMVNTLRTMGVFDNDDISSLKNIRHNVPMPTVEHRPLNNTLPILDVERILCIANMGLASYSVFKNNQMVQVSFYNPHNNTKHNVDIDMNLCHVDMVRQLEYYLLNLNFLARTKRLGDIS